MYTPKTFEQVLHDYQPLLRGLAKRFSVSGEYEEAYQIAQLAFYEAYLNFDPERGYFGAYAKQYVFGRLIKSMKKEITYQKTHYLPSQYGELEMSWEEGIGTTSFYGADQLPLELQEGLSLLTRRERIAIIHCYVLDRTIEELARLEGVTHSTASTWKRRGIEKLRKRFIS